MTTPDLTYTFTPGDGIERTIDVYTTLGAGGWTVPAGVTSYDVLKVAGGGGGRRGPNSGGGGGAGGRTWLTGQSCTPGETIALSVGAGGAAKTVDGIGNNGSDTTFDGLTVKGGGGGAFGGNPQSGGSGGGGAGAGAGSAGTGDPGTPGQGNDGGDGFGATNNNERASGGGGGAGAVGADATSKNGGAGGAGVDMSTLLGTTIGAAGWFAGGGGGGTREVNGSGTAGAGGTGGGAVGGVRSQNGSNATAGTGGGGGGGGGAEPISGTGQGNGGAGGSGIVAIRYIVPTAPGAPTDLAVSDITTTTATATWSAPTTGGTPTGYKVTLDPGTETDAGNVLTYDLTGLTAGTDYTVTVTPYNAAGDGTPDSVDFTTDLPAPPGIPTNVTATPGSTTITLTWDDPVTGDPATSYDVRIDGGSATDAGLVLSYAFTGLTPLTPHTVSVRAVNAAGASDWVVVETTTTAAPPADAYTYDIERDPYVYDIAADDYRFDIEPDPYVYNIRS